MFLPIGNTVRPNNKYLLFDTYALEGYVVHFQMDSYAMKVSLLKHITAEQINPSMLDSYKKSKT